MLLNSLWIPIFDDGGGGGYGQWLYELARSTMTNSTNWVTLLTEIYFLTVLEARSRVVSGISLILRPLFLASRQLWGYTRLHPHLPYVFSSGLPSVRVCILISFYMDTSHIRLGSIHGMLFYLNYLLKHFLKFPNEIRFWGTGDEEFHI
jgi:hypothetical protein